ncbi:MAG: fluoride efflux transporter CrcB [Nitrospirota bacterium]|nr:fluoride efflux transporter CrcB [Nitrospirota bacterium]
MRVILAIGLAGFVGAVSRYLIGMWALRALPAGFPYGTLLVNVTGSLLLGAVFELGALRAGFDPTLRVALATGFLGAFTTFSTFSLETWALLRDGNLMLALANTAGNVVLCVAAAGLGIAVARLAAA